MIWIQIAIKKDDLNKYNLINDREDVSDDDEYNDNEDTKKTLDRLALKFLRTFFSTACKNRLIVTVELLGLILYNLIPDDDC